MANKLIIQARKNKKKGMMRGSKLAFNAAIQSRYERALKNLIKRMSKITRSELKTFYSQDHTKAHFGTDDTVSSQARILTNKLTRRFNAMFLAVSKELAQGMIDQSLKTSESALKTSLKELSGGLTIKTNLMGNGLKDITSAAVTENVGLIKSIPQEYMKNVQGAVMRSITHGNGLEGLIGDIDKIDGVTDRRAKNIALDQTRKVYNSININRSKAVGVTEGEWIHSGGSQRPRESHLALDGTTFNLEEGAYDEDVGEYIYPGELPNCGCTFRPVISFDDNSDEDL